MASAARMNAVRREERTAADIHPIREQRRKEKNGVRLTVSTLLILFAGFSLVILSVMYFIRTQNTLTMSRNQYSSKLSQYEELKRSNDLYEERIISKVDMNEVARIAEEELGMQRASEGQIISYYGQIDDYVKQYTDVPAYE